jgi:5'-3' exonuclease
MSVNGHLLMDASLYVFRSYHARPPDWFDEDGEATHAVFGFVNTLLSLLLKARPKLIAVCFDGAFGQCFRNELAPDYKANREPPDLNLLKQFEYCRAFARALGLTALVDQRYEADDLIASLASSLKRIGKPFVVVSADKDLGQLLSEHDRQWDFSKDEPFGPDGVYQRFGVWPHQMADFQALTGDAIDNVKGIPGVGPKTAAQLLTHFGSLDELLKRTGEVAFLRSIRGAQTLAAKLQQHASMATAARRLTTLADNAPVPAPDQLALKRPDIAEFDALAIRAGFGQTLRARARHWSKLHFS